MEMLCFCGGPLALTALIKQGGGDRYFIGAKCSACESSYEFRNWPLGGDEVLGLEKEN